MIAWMLFLLHCNLLCYFQFYTLGVCAKQTLLYDALSNHIQRNFFLLWCQVTTRIGYWIWILKWKHVKKKRSRKCHIRGFEWPGQKQQHVAVVHYPGMLCRDRSRIYNSWGWDKITVWIINSISAWDTIDLSFSHFCLLEKSSQKKKKRVQSDT